MVFSRVESFLLFHFAVNTLIVAISIIYMDQVFAQVQNDLTNLNAQIEEKNRIGRCAKHGQCTILRAERVRNCQFTCDLLKHKKYSRIAERYLEWTKSNIRYATKNRKSPAENRLRVKKSLSLLSVFVFAVFLVNFAVIIGTGTRWNTDLAKS